MLGPIQPKRCVCCNRNSDDPCNRPGRILSSGPNNSQRAERHPNFLAHETSVHPISPPGTIYVLYGRIHPNL